MLRHARSFLALSPIPGKDHAWKRGQVIVPMLLMTMILSLAFAGGARAAFNHDLWDNLLQKNVQMIDGGKESRVNYRAMAAAEPELEQYLNSLSQVSRSRFDKWSKDDQLAFLINAYNAWTVQLIVEHYPNLKSIKDLGSFFESPWKKIFIPLLGKQRSLDDIEQGLIRGSGRYNDPRIHFALNCASLGCPALYNRAYRGDILDRQLDKAARLFLSDRTRNRLEGRTLWVSSIFKWYRGDFAGGWRGATSLGRFLALYANSLGLSKDQTAAVVDGRIDIEFLDYDWRLNDVK